MVSKAKKIAIGLQGGGSHGAFAWGVLDALLADKRIEIIGLSGTSAGGMNAAALLQGFNKGGRDGAREELRRFWKLVNSRSSNLPMRPNMLQAMLGSYSLRGSPVYAWMNMLRDFYSPYEINPLDINPLKSLVHDFFDMDLIHKSSSMKIFLCATHVKTGKLHIFHGKTLSENALLASACLPSFFRAVEVDGEYFWDGGYVGNPAIHPLIFNCATDDIAIIQLTQANRTLLPTSADAIMDRYQEITYNACLMHEMRAIHLISTLVEKGAINDPAIRKLNMHVIRNKELFEELDLSTALNTDWKFLEYLFDAGFKSGQRWLDKHYEDIGKRSSAKIEEDFI
jgi:NTE family protein